MKKRNLAVLLTVVMVLASLAACGSSDNQPTATTAPTNTTAPTEAVAATDTPTPTITETPTPTEDPANREVTVTDMSGDQVTIKGEVKSIINLWPAGTSSFIVMGAGKLLSGLAINNAGTINSWAKLFYPEAGDIPAMGGTTPSIEDILTKDPDLVIVHPMTVKSGLAQQIRDAGVPAININFSTYDTMITSYTMLGQAIGGEYQEKLATWCQMVTEKEAAVSAITKDVADADKPVVYYIGGQADSLTTTMGSNSICADWTHMAGGVYLTDLLEDTTVTEVTAEQIFALDPDVIIVGGTYQHKIIEELQTTDGWKELSAVKNGRVYGNPYGAFAWDRFGLESYMQMDFALTCIQPELAEKAGVTTATISEEVKNFYKTMNGTELTDDQVSYMLAGHEADGTELDPDTSGSGMGQGSGNGQGRGGN